MKESAALQIRPLTDLDEFASVVSLQQEIWGFDDVDLLPRRLFVVASKIGGQLLGAFDGSQMVAFCLCIPGLKPGGRPYLHSHMLGVLPAYRNTGVGRRLKLVQRDYAIANNIQLVEWTFDPLEIKNAFFNIERLGAVVRRYSHNQYGLTTSTLHGGLPTDRLTAEWWVQSPRVASLVSPSHEVAASPSKFAEREISIPVNVERLRSEDPAAAKEIQTRVRDEFVSAFAAGLTVTGFQKTEDAGKYLLQKWQSD